MTRLLLTLPACALAAACATDQRPYAPVRDIRYQALGSQPFWLLAIGDDRIVLRTTQPDDERSWPRTLPRTQGVDRAWRSGEGETAILVEASDGPCSDDRGVEYADHVRVTFGARELHGCGGRQLRGEER
ncbi:MAG TPA: hypothetical protein VJS15_05355 [Allosphingosinicella sp.]|nr:hypothetical protein [Allosphingosinicella sp.]